MKQQMGREPEMIANTQRNLFRTLTTTMEQPGSHKFKIALAR